MFFSNVKQFPAVIDGRIEIVPFLEASKGVVQFVDLLGSVFIPVKSDINGNIEKLYKIYHSNEEKFLALNDIVAYEMNNTDPKVGIDALLWLKRALEYVHVFLTCLVNDSKEEQYSDNLVPFFNKAYEEKLKPYHGWFVQKIFGLIVHAAPSRKSLLHLLAGENSTATESDVIKETEDFLQSLGNNIDVINDLYRANNLDNTDKV